VAFDGVDTVLGYDVVLADDWVVLRLARISGARPETVTVLRLQAAKGGAWRAAEHDVVLLAPFCFYTLQTISIRYEGTFECLRYNLGGDHPSQTTHQTMSFIRITES